MRVIQEKKQRNLTGNLNVKLVAKLNIKQKKKKPKHKRSYGKENMYCI